MKLNKIKIPVLNLVERLILISWLIINIILINKEMVKLNQEINNNIYNLSIPHQVKIIPKESFITKNAIVYAYTANKNETDNSPCITANGTNACQPPFAMVANNCLKFGSLVEINGKRYKVADRMNKRYNCQNFDILMPTKKDALNWGKQYLTIKIYN